MSSLVKLRELFDQSRKVVVPMHPAKQVRLMANVSCLMSNSKVKELALQTISGLMDEGRCLRQELRKVLTKWSDLDALLQILEVLQAEVVAAKDKIAIFSAARRSTKRIESVLAVLRQKGIDVGLIKERESGYKRRLNALKAKLSSLRVTCA